MANGDNILKTRIVLRNDATANWEQETAVKLLKGEVGVEFLADGTAKIKIGDGEKAWKDLPYYAGDKTNVLKVTPVEQESDIEAINKAAAGLKIIVGDIAVVTRVIYGDKKQLTAYSYDGENWVAMDGNYDAQNVYFDKDLVTTSAIGNITLENGQATIPAAGLNLLEVFNKIFVKAQDPKVTDPTASITLQKTGAHEVGTVITPTYAASLSAGSYSYGPDTGVVADTYTITDSLGKTASTSTGTFDDITVSENTKYYVSATISHNEGAIPVDNTGVEKENLKIVAGSKSATSASITGYRAWFQGYKTESNAIADPAAISSAEVRALGTSRNGSFNTTVSTDGMKQMFFAAPAGKVKSLKVANAVNGAPQTVTKGTATVEGANGFEAITYDVFYVSNAVAESGASKYTITVG